MVLQKLTDVATTTLLLTLPSSLTSIRGTNKLLANIQYTLQFRVLTYIIDNNYGITIVKKSFFFPVEVAFSISFYYYSLISWYLTFQNISFFLSPYWVWVISTSRFVCSNSMIRYYIPCLTPKTENTHYRKVNIQCKTIWAINSPSTFFFSNPCQNVIYGLFYNLKTTALDYYCKFFFVWVYFQLNKHSNLVFSPS